MSKGREKGRAARPGPGGALGVGNLQLLVLITHCPVPSLRLLSLRHPHFNYTQTETPSRQPSVTQKKEPARASYNLALNWVQLLETKQKIVVPATKSIVAINTTEGAEEKDH